jgi:hypothetical protein
MANYVRRFFDLGFVVPSVDVAPAVEQPEPRLYAVGVIALAAAGLGSLLAFAIVLLLVTTALDVLRRHKNPTYWEIACWGLVTIGIVARQTVQPTYSVEISGLAPPLFIASALVSLAVMPGLMRWLNRASPSPTLQHVAVPFSLGFFLDYAQVLASRYVIQLPWVPNT